MVMARRKFLAGGVALAGAALVPARAARAAAADLDFASALDAARAIRTGQVSSLELTTRMLERIAQHNPKLNAIVMLTADSALARARAADEARARREWWGPFHGVPGTIKDTFEVAGVTTTAGSAGLRNHVPTRDAAVAARLRGAGMIILGKSNVPLFAADWQSYNAVYGQTNNPWDVTRTPGGSTGGGAAALAAGFTYLEPGSALAGSIRIPAHFCGIYGHKPSLDVVPMRGHIPLPPARGARLRDYRIGYMLDDPRGAVVPAVGEVLAPAVEALRKAGAQLEQGWPPGLNVEEQYDAYLTILYA